MSDFSLKDLNDPTQFKGFEGLIRPNLGTLLKAQQVDHPEFRTWQTPDLDRLLRIQLTDLGLD